MTVELLKKQGTRYRAFVLPLLLSMLGHAALIWSVEEIESGVGTNPALRESPPQEYMQLRFVDVLQPPAKKADAPAAEMLSPHSASAAATAPLSAEKSEAITGNGQPIYYQLKQLDGPVLPTSAPDTSRLRNLTFSGQPIRLRLWISAAGSVERIDVLQASAADREAVAQLKAMYYDTAYIPARRHGKAVAVRMNMELAFMSTAQTRTVF